MPDFEDSTLWRISAYERFRQERGTSAFAPLGGNTVLPTTLMADLRHLEARREQSDVLEIAAACMRHRQSALLCLRYDDLVWPVTLFPAEMLYHAPRDLSAVPNEALGAIAVINCDPPGLRPPGHYMHERIGRREHYWPLKPLLWKLALHGPRHALLNEIAGPTAYRVTMSREDRPDAPGAMGPAAERLRTGAATLREMSSWPGMSVERASRLLNGLYLCTSLMVLRAAVSGSADKGNLVGRLIGRKRAPR